MSKEVKRYTANVFIPGNLGPVRREVVMEDDYDALLAERDALKKALAGLLALDEEDHQRYPGDEDVCAEVRDARAALQGEQP